MNDVVKPLLLNETGEKIAEAIRQWGTPSDAQADASIQRWLDNHPEATTTVQDQSLTMDKMVVGTLGYVTPKMFGAKGDGITDDTEAIQAAIHANANVVIQEGIYAVYGTIHIKDGESVKLQNNAVLVKPKDANNTDPVVWIRGIYSSLIGSGMTNSWIRSQVESPRGVLLLGDRDMTATGANTLYNTVRDIGIEGHSEGGNASGADTKAVYICCSDGYNMACYFNTLQNLYIAKANNGLMLEGYANANIIENIQFRHVGNEKYLDGAAIHLKNTNDKYPLENTITNTFHHQSWNAVTLYFDGRVIYNSVQNIISEQMGPNAIGLKANHVCDGNNISIIENTAAGNNLVDGFLQSNTVVTRNTFYARNASMVNLYFRNGIFTEKQKGFSISGCTDGTAYKLFSVEDLTSELRNNQILVDFEVTQAANGATRDFWATYGKASYVITANANAELSVREISCLSNKSILCVPVVDGRKVIFLAKPTFLTGTVNVRLNCKYSVRTACRNITVTEHNTPETVPNAVANNSAILQTSKNGTTTNRPTASLSKGQLYFDTTLGKPIWYNGKEWVDASGTVV